MKKIVALGLFGGLALSTQAQELKSSTDSLSYALGQDIAQSMKAFGVELDAKIMSESLTKALAGEASLFSKEESQRIIREHIMAAQEAKTSVFKEQSQRFFKENGEKPDVHTDLSGLQYTVLKPGSGANPTIEDEVTVHYIGKLEDGTTFDNSYDRGEPITFNTGSMIKGWQIAIPMMQKGAKYRFFIPYNLGYGERGAGKIPPYATLIFDVELLDIKKGG